MIEFEIREGEIDGVKEWIWIKGDDGLWIGPKEDWVGYHKHKILKYCKNFRVVVQAGGGCGMYPRLLSNIFDVVYTFEPCESSFYCLVHNCYNRKIIKFNAAVGPERGLVTMVSINEHNRGTARVEEKGNSYIPMIPIDSIPYGYCDLLMLDVEGFEGEALKGAMETIHKFNPVIFAERGWQVTEWIKNLGYEEVDKSVADTIFMRERPENI
jgi:FkbM family methyltransferase